MRYFALIDGEPGNYGVAFPDLPGCTAMGVTVDDAIRAAGESLTDWVGTYERAGGTIPPARSAVELMRDPEVAADVHTGAALVAVLLVRATGKPVRANLSLDEGVVAALDTAARNRGVTRSAMVSIIVQQHLHGMA